MELYAQVAARKLKKKKKVPAISSGAWWKHVRVIIATLTHRHENSFICARQLCFITYLAAKVYFTTLCFQFPVRQSHRYGDNKKKTVTSINRLLFVTITLIALIGPLPRCTFFYSSTLCLMQHFIRWNRQKCLLIKNYCKKKKLYIK